MGCKSCAEKAKRQRAEFLRQQRQRERKTKPTVSSDTNTAEYTEAIRKLRK